MIWLRTLILFDKGNLVSSTDWHTIHGSYRRSIESIEHPPGSGSFTIRRKKRKRPQSKQWFRNGVGYLKQNFLDHIKNVEGWQAEGVADLGLGNQPPIYLYPSGQPYPIDVAIFGEFDLVTTAPQGTRVAIEWETGNVSSSHRSMNKLVLALEAGSVSVGVLIVPGRVLYQHLTDRIGNFEELSGYMRMWQSFGANVENGLLAVSVVEYDHLTDDPAIPYLPMAEDGNAARGRRPGRRRARTRGQ
jgi:Restriction endonuclease BamHI